MWCWRPGPRWRRDGIGRSRHAALPGLDAGPLLIPDDVMAEDFDAAKLPTGPVVVYDDDGYVMGGLMAEVLAKAGHAVTLVTPAALVSDWTRHALDQPRIHRRLVECGVKIRLNKVLTARSSQQVALACSYTGAEESLDCATLVLVTSRLPNEAVYLDLKSREADWADAGIATVKVIGDARAPGTIAAAVFAGHRYAREFGESVDPDVTPFRREAIGVD